WETPSTPADPSAQDRYVQELVAYHEKLLAGNAEAIEPTIELPAALASRLARTQSVLILLEQDRRRTLSSLSITENDHLFPGVR
ncbi:MAG: hypothetical protein ACKO23_19460, partial [Gemmataceae bacterium]